LRSTLFLLQMAGTSGVGKSTLARKIAEQTGAVIIDYDIIKSAALDAGALWDLAGGVGYRAGHALARSILQQSLSVILDSPCRFQQIVDVGTAIAAGCGALYAFVECVLADEGELRRRMLVRARHRSQRRAFDIPPPDAPNDVMADESGRIHIPESKFPSSPWLRIDMSQPVEICLAGTLAYLARIGAASSPHITP
jgi:predicted kinase